jgi:hypothetical protein
MLGFFYFTPVQGPRKYRDSSEALILRLSK